MSLPQSSPHARFVPLLALSSVPLQPLGPAPCPTLPYPALPYPARQSCGALPVKTFLRGDLLVQKEKAVVEKFIGKEESVVEGLGKKNETKIFKCVTYMGNKTKKKCEIHITLEKF